MLFNEREIKTDAEGYLLDEQDWSLDLMHHMADEMGLTLSDRHITIIKLVREYYFTYATTPPMRGLIALLKKKGYEDLASSVALARLFPDGAAKCAAKLAGLKKPVKCI